MSGVEESNSVRVVDSFVDGLDLADLGFDGVEPAATGRPAYHPSVLLNLYIYGYLNRVQSSRRLEREAGRNLEVIWLLGRLVPDDKVIADFRKDNGPAIRRVCASFVNLCRQMGLLAKASVAIDGASSKRSIIEIVILHEGRSIAGARSRRVWRGISPSSIRRIGRNRLTCSCSRRRGSRRSSTS
jgi:transposase